MDRLPLGQCCTKCGEWKLYSEFSRERRKKSGVRSSCKKCGADYSARYYEENRSERLDYAAVYRAANLEVIAAYKREWVARNRAYKVEQDRKWREENRSRKSARDRLYYENNRDEILQGVRRYRLANPAKQQELSRIKRARRSNADGSFTSQEWRELCEAHNHRCLCCGVTESLTADHVIPLSKGGSNHIDNIQPLCRPCNSRKGTRIIDYR